MKEDFNWLRKVFKNPSNNTKHFESLYALSELFKKKWKHYEKDPKHKSTYSLYVSYLRITLKSIDR
jgi:hypothetical protein